MTDFTVMEPTRSLLYGESFTWSMQIRDGAGDLADPVSNQVTVQITDSAGAIKLGVPTYATRSDIGIFYHTYAVPGIGPAGIWIITFSYTLGTLSPIHTRKFIVDQILSIDYTAVPSTIDVSYMRGYLSDIGEGLLPTSTLSMYILKDSTYIDSIKNANASSDIVAWAKVTRIAYHCFAWYTSQYERTFSEQEVVNNREALTRLEAESIDWELLARNASTEEIAFEESTIAMKYGKSVSLRIT
jgi:hypothetical protein